MRSAVWKMKQENTGGFPFPTCPTSRLKRHVSRKGPFTQAFFAAQLDAVYAALWVASRFKHVRDFSDITATQTCVRVTFHTKIIQCCMSLSCVGGPKKRYFTLCTFQVVHCSFSVHFNSFIHPEGVTIWVERLGGGAILFPTCCAVRVGLGALNYYVLYGKAKPRSSKLYFFTTKLDTIELWHSFHIPIINTVSFWRAFNCVTFFSSRHYFFYCSQL